MLFDMRPLFGILGYVTFEHKYENKRINYLTYPKIPNKGRTSNNMCAPLFWRKKINWKIKGANQIKSARTLFEMRPLIGTLGCAV